MPFQSYLVVSTRSLQECPREHQSSEIHGPTVVTLNPQEQEKPYPIIKKRSKGPKVGDLLRLFALVTLRAFGRRLQGRVMVTLGSRAGGR